MIKVQGTSKIDVTPDYVTIPITISETASTFEESVKGLNAKTANIYKDLAQLGFSEDIAITSYSSRENSSFIGNEKKVTSYTRDLVLQIEFDYDQSKLVNTITGLNNSSSNPEFRTIFSVKDIEKVYDELRHDAVKSAMNNATVLADSANLSLEQIVSIEYLKNNPTLYRAGIEVVSFVPTDKTYTDSVILEYKTSPK